VFCLSGPPLVGSLHHDVCPLRYAIHAGQCRTRFIPARKIFLILEKIRLLSERNGPEVGEGSVVEGLLAESAVFGEGGCGEDADNDEGDEELEEGEAALRDDGGNGMVT
jgi:hypothetical protein